MTARSSGPRATALLEAGKDAPVTADTLFQAASISKPVSAMAALRLVDQGALDLDRDVNQLLTSWKVPENEFTRQHDVDLRGILSHTAGLTVHGFDGYSVGTTLPTVPQILAGTPPANNKPVVVDKLPGKGFRYAGGGTTVMQLLLTEITAKTFAELMHESVLSPLGMAASTYEQPLPENRHATRGQRTRRPRPRDRRPLARVSRAGRRGIVDHTLRSGPLCDRGPAGARGQEPEDSLARRWSTRCSRRRATARWGWGPMLEGAGDTRRFEHGGANAGYRCELVAYVSRGQGAVVMTNCGSGDRLVPRSARGHRQRLRLARLPGRREDDRQSRASELDRFVGGTLWGPSAR